ncbi:MAG: MATE family efflux transporter [Paramuribaculum sp.]|nr:MATE family efflux transporter [Paramuribaculum sp.]
MNNSSIDLGKDRIPYLFKIYLVPTLLGMLALCAVTATDGIFVGQGAGSEALAAVNICIAPTMLMMGIGLMLGIGASVISSINLANNNVTAARLNITQSLVFGTAIVGIFLIVTLISPADTARVLGSSETLLPLVLDYMPWIFVTCLFQLWCGIGLFVIRLDGAPQYAMWCNVIPGLLNVILDYLFIFPLDMGILGAAIATTISCFTGFVMVLIYITGLASQLKLIRLNWNRDSLRLMSRNIWNQCKIGISALLGETTMGVLMLTGNIVFMHYLGDNGVGAFSIACYYCPFAFMIGNAIAQAAQPIISYNYGMNESKRVTTTERLAIITAVAIGSIVTMAFCIFPSGMVGLFLDTDTEAAQIAIDGMPSFATAFVFFVFNLTAIGYFQSVKMVIPSVVFALLRGAVLLVPAFIIMPIILGIKGIWLALFASEFLTSICITSFYLYNKRSGKR